MSRSLCWFALSSALLFTVAGHADTFDWGGTTGVWSADGNWTPSGAPPAGHITPVGGGAPGDTIQFSNQATSTYTSTYDFIGLTEFGQPIATFFNLDRLNLNGGATSATGSNTINRTPDIFNNLRFADNGGGIVNSTSNGIGYTLDIAVLGINTLNLSGNGTSLVTFTKGIFPDVLTSPPSLNIVKTGTSTFEFSGTSTFGSSTTTNVLEGALQFGTTAASSMGPINLGALSGSSSASLILPNGVSLNRTADITVVNSGDGGTRTITSTAVGLSQYVNIEGDIAINHSGGLRIATGAADIEGPPSVNLTGAISGSGDLIVTGTGRVVTSGSMTGFTGDIIVESGSYADMGSFFGGGSTVPVIVGDGAGNAGMNFTNNGATYAQPITVGTGAGGRDFSVTENGTLNGAITFNNGADLTVAAGKAFVIEGGLTGAAGGLDKQGLGTLTLSGNSTSSSPSYTADTTVSEGTLNVNRDISGSDVTVAVGATLKGSGAVGAVGGAGLLSPGNSPGIMTTSQIAPVGGLDFASELTRTNANGGTDFGSATNPFNDVVRITDPTPFLSSLGGGNKVGV